ncbi:MAG: ABC transporter substrate-binding protein [Symploca sp. SIO2E9]|nr:ABC transporter substrate-binding protein [Symploca sp. SIO2E9]
MLRGVAQAQTQVNLGLFDTDDQLLENFPGKGFLKDNSIKNTRGLRVAIADDSNNEEEAKLRAQTLVKQGDILGVVGHYTSEMTLAVINTYQDNQLVLISAGTTTEELSGKALRSGKLKDVFFRTVPNVAVHAQSLVDYLSNQAGQKQVAILYNHSSPYTYSFKEEFTKAFQDNGGKVVKQYSLTDSEFNAKKIIEELRQQKLRQQEEIALVLLPDGQVTNSLDNAIEVIKANNNSNWIGASWSLYSPKTLAIADFKLLEKLVL